MLKASIIIPVYNAEKVLERCLESVLKQNYKNYEVIIINDGSTDKSQEIINKYESEFKGIIKSYKQSNVGQGETRNRGIHYSTGDYLFFVDNDDYIDSDYIEKFMKAAREESADIIIGGHVRIDSKGRIVSRIKIKNTEWAPFEHIVPWARAYKRKFILDNNLCFLNAKIGEDTYINLMAAISANSISVINYCGYHYYINIESMSNSKQKRFQMTDEVINMLTYTYNECMSKINTKQRNLLEYYYIRYVIWYLLFSGRKVGREKMSYNYDLMFNTLEKMFCNYKRNSLIRPFRPKGQATIISLIVYFAVLLHKVNLLKPLMKIYSEV